MNKRPTQDVVLEGCFPPPHLKPGNIPLKPFPMKAAFLTSFYSHTLLPNPFIKHCLAPPSNNFSKFLHNPGMTLPSSPGSSPTLLTMPSSAPVLLFAIPLPAWCQRTFMLTPLWNFIFYSFLTSCKYSQNLDFIVPQNFSIIKILSSSTLFCAHTCLVSPVLSSQSSSHFTLSAYSLSHLFSYPRGP